MGLLFGRYALALLIASPIMGIWSDRVGRQRPLLLGLLGLAAATLLFAYASGFWMLLIARVLQGIAAAASWTAGLALLADIYPGHQRGKVRLRRRTNGEVSPCW
ncbi:MFS transporter [Paenibacillaceae bacterium]|nr:MFS transporter [Paenibacillaceae bacterium]